MKIISQNKLGTTYFDPDQKILVSVYKGRAIISLALEHLANIVDFYANNEVKGAVVDVKEVHGSFVKVLNYMRDTLNPVAVKSGLTCQVYVLSEDLIITNLGIKLKELAKSFNINSEVFFR